MRFFLIGLIVNLLPSIDLIILEILKVPENLVGFFSAITRIVPIIWVIYEAMNAVMAPTFAESFKEDITLFRHHFYSTQRTVALSVLLLFVLVQIFMPEFVGLFGAKYLPIIPYTRVIATVACIQVSCCTMQVALQYSGYERIFSKIITIALLLNIALDFLLIPQYQLTGAIIAYSTAALTITAYTLYQGYRKLNLLPFSH